MEIKYNSRFRIFKYIFKLLYFLLYWRNFEKVEVLKKYIYNYSINIVFKLINIYTY